MWKGTRRGTERQYGLGKYENSIDKISEEQSTNYSWVRREEMWKYQEVLGDNSLVSDISFLEELKNTLCLFPKHGLSV